jgi:hypothetical protein
MPTRDEVARPHDAVHTALSRLRRRDRRLGALLALLAAVLLAVASLSLWLW